VADWFQQQASSGSLLLAIPVALVAGLVSFFSPCVIPLLPGYLSYATGLSGADLEHARRGRMLAGAVLFVLGFSAVYVVVGFTAGSFGTWLIRSRTQLEVVLGVVMVLLGLAFAGLVPFVQRDLRVHTIPAVGLGAAPVIGFLFGLGWTPCIGPTLAAIITLGINEGTAGRGALLAAVYCLGLGVPFIVAALAYRRALGAFQVIRRHQQWVTRIGGAMLVLVGLALVTGFWDQAVSWIQLHLVDDSSVAL
jgi:cytochrome c-type biogenesis protein